MALSAVLSKEMAIILGSKGAELAPALATPNYTLGTGWSYGTSPATIQKIIDGTGTVTPATQTIAAGSLYVIEMDISSISGNTATWTLGSTAGTAITAVGKVKQFLLATDTAKLIITPVATNLRMVISNISVKLVTCLTLGFATDFDFEINKQTIDVTTLSSAGWKAFMVDLKEWKVSFSGLITRGVPGATEICAADLLTSIIGVDTPLIAAIKTATSGDQYFVGEAFLTSFKNSGSVGDKIKYSGDLQGSGPISLLTNV